VHNTSSAAAKAFNAETGFDVEDLLVDIYFWFVHSTKRKCQLAEYADFCDQGYRKITKHVSTRWLSLENVITRTLLQYQSLKSYFLSEDESAARFKRLETAFNNPMTEVYLLFLQSALQIFVNLNLFLQKEEPLISAINSSLTKFLKLLACKLISSGIVKASSSFKQLLDVEQYLPDSLIDVGFVTRTALNNLVSSGDIGAEDEKRFYEEARSFFIEVFEYAVSHMAVNDELLVSAEMVYFEEREKLEPSMVQYFVQRYPNLLPFTSAKDLEELTQKVHDFATMDEEELPKSVRELANANEGGSRLRPDIVWGHLQELTTLDGHKRFPRLSKIAMLVLTIPHSNAGEERVFSMIKKNLTSLRSCLDQEETLGSIMTIKMESLNSPGKIGLPPNVLKAAKSATRLYNKAHS